MSQIDYLETKIDTLQHIRLVNRICINVAQELLNRAESHDRSKLSPVEMEAFSKTNAKLAGLTYGSPEYKECLKELGPALEHHYSCNRHHPEHFKSGIEDMNLLDIFEMIIDWYAASQRHDNGDIHKSILINTERFGLSPQLATILHNTADALVECNFEMYPED